MKIYKATGLCIILYALLMVVSCNSNTEKSYREIAKEAWLYNYSMFYNYKSIYHYSVNEQSPDYTDGYNRFKHFSRMFTHEDTTIVTPNNDTPYSWAILDLSTEPVVMEVPAMTPENRYYVMQLIDLYTFNFAYIGSRTTGNKSGKYMIAGPEWNGSKPKGIDSVFQSETNLVTVLGRTELLSEGDMPEVEKLQAQYKLSTLHEYMNQPTPQKKEYAMLLPEWDERVLENASFINTMNALLQYASIHDSEKEMKEHFAKIGIIPGQSFDPTKYSKEELDSINAGVQDAKRTLQENIAGTINSMNLFGTRDDIGNDPLVRAIAAAMGIYGNTKEEAVYVGSQTDVNNDALLGENNYILHFTKEQIPQVKYFWSITVYNLPQRSLVENPIARYALNDKSNLSYNEDGSLDIYLQSTSPKENTSNWLPTPTKGLYNYVIRIYGPSDDIINGKWKQPLPTKRM